MINAAFLAVTAIVLASALIKAASMLAPRRQPGQGLVLLLLITLAATCFGLSDTALYQEDRLYPDLGRLLSNLTTMIAAFGILALVITISLPPPQARPRVRRRLAALAACTAGMTAAFAAASPLPETFGDFGDLYTSRPELLGYIVLYIAFLGIALGELMIAAWRYARLARHQPWLRAGLLLMATGSVLGLVYLAEKALYVFTQAAHLPPPFASDHSCTSLVSPPQCAFSVTLPITSVLLAAIGATVPVWGPVASWPVRYYRNQRTFGMLEPLWQRLCREFPRTALGEPGGTRWDLSFRLYRRIIEIDDGRLLLRPYMSAAVAEAAARAGAARGLRGEDLRAVVEAAGIAAALRAREHGILADSAAPVPEHADLDSGGVLREAGWLVKVARAYAASPVVRDIAGQRPQQAAHPERPGHAF